MPKSGIVVDAAAAGVATAVVGDARGAAAAPGAGAAPGFASSTSALTIRPPGPVPLMVDKSMPFSAAMRLASGEAMTRSPEAGAGAGDGAAGAAAAAGAGSAFAAGVD